MTMTYEDEVEKDGAPLGDIWTPTTESGANRVTEPTDPAPVHPEPGSDAETPVTAILNSVVVGVYEDPPPIERIFPMAARTNWFNATRKEAGEMIGRAQEIIARRAATGELVQEEMALAQAVRDRAVLRVRARYGLREGDELLAVHVEEAEALAREMMSMRLIDAAMAARDDRLDPRLRQAWTTPEGLKRYRVIVGPNGEVLQPGSCWVVDVDADREQELRRDLDDVDHMGALLERKYAARWLSKEMKDPPDTGKGKED
jgi:hypothetical protein